MTRADETREMDPETEMRPMENWTNPTASYPATSGDRDEYIADRITVSVDDTTSSSPLAGGAQARFAGSETAEARAWLIEHGVDDDEARRMVRVVTRNRDAALWMIAKAGVNVRGWAEVGQAASESIRRRVDHLHPAG